jgi:trimeric autotransporter adhesin
VSHGNAQKPGKPTKNQFAPATLALIAVVMFATSAQANICRVTSDGTDSGDGSDWGGQAMDLHSALGDSACSEIWVKKGVYKPVTPVDSSAVTRAEREVSFRIDRALAIYGGFDGTEILLEQRDPDTHLTVLSGDIDGNDVSDQNGITQNAADISGANSFHVLWIDGGSVSGGITQTTRIDGLIISAGLADDSFDVVRCEDPACVPKYCIQ